MKRIARCLVVLCLFALASGYVNGAPLSSCPASGILSVTGSGSVHPIKAGTNGFTIVTSSQTWTAGTPITVSIRGSATWDGILLVAYSGATASTGAGQWTVTPGYKTVTAATKYTLTQTNKAVRGPASVDFTWTPPAAGTGTVTFKSIIVVSASAAYNLASVAVTERAAVPTVAPTTPAATPAATPAVTPAATPAVTPAATPAATGIPAAPTLAPTPAATGSPASAAPTLVPSTFAPTPAPTTVAPTPYVPVYGPPSAPYGVVVSFLNSTALTLSWTHNLNDLPNIMKIQVYVAPLSTQVFALKATLNSTVTGTGSATIIRLTASTAYSLIVKSQSAGGISEFSSLPVNFTTPASGSTTSGIVYPPVLSTGVTPIIESDAQFVNASWAESFSFNQYPAANYTLQYQYITSNGTSAWLTAYSGPLTSFSLAIPSAVSMNGVTIVVRVQAQSTVSNSAWTELSPVVMASTACPNNCYGHGNCVATVCQCNSNFVGPDCGIPVANTVILYAPANLVMSSTIVGPLIHFRLSSNTGPVSLWMSVCIKVLADGMLNGDCAVVSYSTQVPNTDFGLEDHTTPAVKSVTTYDDQQDLLHGNVWTMPDNTLVATYSRLLVTNDTAQDQSIDRALMSMSWAVGTSSEYVTHDPSPTGCGKFMYNFFTGEFIVFTGRIRATWLISLSFILPIVGLTLLSILVYKVPFVTNSRVGRWFLHGRPSAISWSGSFDPFLDKITLGAVSTFQSLTFCERLFLLLFFGMIAAFLQLSVREYYLAGKNWFLNFGFLTSVLFSLTLLPVSRTSIFLYSIGLPFERALKWHRLFACSAGLVMLIHAGSMIYDNRTDLPELLEQNVNIEGYGNFWGTLSGIALAPIFMFSIDPIRRRFFELFYYVHQLYLIGIVFAWIHSMSALYLGILPMTTHIVDRVLRRYRSTRPVTLRGAKVLSAGDGKQLTEIRLFAPEMAHFEAGDYVFLQIEQISLLEWHPFTISSSPQEHADSGELTLHILSIDDADTFSARVAKWAQTEVPQVMMSTLPRILQSECSLDGPYGRISLPHWHFEYTHIFLCAGGVGVTPMTSILSDLVYRHRNGQLKHVQSVNFVWVNQSSDPVLQWFPTLLQSAQQLGAPFELHLHVTDSLGSSSTTSVKPAAESVGIEMQSKILPTHHRRDSRIAADTIAFNGFAANDVVPVCDFDEYQTDEGIPYYVDKMTGESQWEEPVPKAQPAPASSAKPMNHQRQPSNAEKHVDKKHVVEHDFHIKAGRPDYLALFQRVACVEGIAGGCVMSCGPIAMVESIRSAAAQVGFDLHEESFLF